MKKYLILLLLPFLTWGQFNPVAFYEYGANKTTLLVSTSLSGSAKYAGSTLAQNGCIYFTPGTATQVAKFNPVTKITTLIGSTYTATSNHKWTGGTLFTDGKIYCFPQVEVTFQSVLVIDTATDTTSLISIGTRGLGAGVLVSSGYIYAPPLGDTATNKVYKFNPLTGTGVFVGTDYGGGTGKWYCGIYANNNKVYFVNLNYNQILELDPSTDTTTLVGSIDATSGKYAAATLALNGNIYIIPYNASRILEFNPSTLTSTLVGATISGTAKYGAFILGLNGKLYGIPLTNGKVLEFDTSTLAYKLIGNDFGTTSLKWFSGKMVNGDIYGVPYNSNSILKINKVSGTNVVGTDADIPSPLSNLPTSNYNKYYNKF
jgi:hypothetical protein